MMRNDHVPLSDELRATLRMLGLISQATNDDITFEYRSLPGYPIGWVLHPGLTGGTCAISNANLFTLRDDGCIACDDDPTTAQRMRFWLTDRGIDYYRMMMIGLIADGANEYGAEC